MILVDDSKKLIAKHFFLPLLSTLAISRMLHTMGNPAKDMIYYDGNCGLCHGFVRFVLKRDKAAWFHFAPLQGNTFLENIPKEARDSLPDTVVVQEREGQLMTRSQAVLYVLHRLGGIWKIIAVIKRTIPTFLRDFFYDLIARTRHRLFRRPETLCPIIPEALRSRFLP